MNHSNLIDNYLNFLNSFSEIDSKDFNLDSTEISEAIFVHIYRLKTALWKQSINLKRKKRHSISDIFQDIIALYIKLALDENFEVVLEEKKGKFQPDILIKYKGDNLFVIEVKTTIGWERNSLNGHFQTRIKAIAETFEIDEENIIYIFQSPWNVNRNFTSKYLDLNSHEAKPLPIEFPFNKIRPLMTGDDPFYDKNISIEIAEKIEYQEIVDKASKKIIIPLELTIKEIINAAKIKNGCS